MKYEEWIEYERARLAALQQSLVDHHESAEPKKGGLEANKSGDERQADVDQKDEGGAVFPV